MPEKSTPVNLNGESSGDSTVAQTVSDVRDKANAVKLNKDGTPRKQYTSSKRNIRGPENPPAPASQSLGVAGFTEEQVAASVKGLFSVAALATNCNVWFLSDDEAKCFVPSSTLALNQTFPSVAQSKWGALSLAALSFTAVVTAKTLVYMQYKASLARKAVEEPATAPNAA